MQSKAGVNLQFKFVNLSIGELLVSMVISLTFLHLYTINQALENNLPLHISAVMNSAFIQLFIDFMLDSVFRDPSVNGGPVMLTVAEL
jgi:hypothetical protein